MKAIRCSLLALVLCVVALLGDARVLKHQPTESHVVHEHEASHHHATVGHTGSSTAGSPSKHHSTTPPKKQPKRTKTSAHLAKKKHSITKDPVHLTKKHAPTKHVPVEMEHPLVLHNKTKGKKRNLGDSGESLC